MFCFSRLFSSGLPLLYSDFSATYAKETASAGAAAPVAADAVTAKKADGRKNQATPNRQKDAVLPERKGAVSDAQPLLYS